MKPDFTLYKGVGCDDDDPFAYGYKDLYFTVQSKGEKSITACEFYAGKGWMHTATAEFEFGYACPTPIPIYQGDFYGEHCLFGTLYLDKFELRLNKGNEQLPKTPKGDKPKGERIVCKSYNTRRLPSGEIELVIFK